MLYWLYKRTEELTTMSTLQESLTATLGATTIKKAEVDVKRGNMPVKRQFDRAAAKCVIGNLGRIQSLCAAAREYQTTGRVTTAQKALLTFLLENRDKKASLTREEFIVLSEQYYGFHLADTRGCEGWGTPEEIWDNINGLSGKLNY